MFSWHPPNPDKSGGLLDGEACFITPENAFPLLQSPMAVRFTSLQLTLSVAHGDLRFVCSCSEMETHFMKLSMNSACADVVSRVSFWNSVVSVSTDDTIFLRYVLQHSAVPLCELVWPLSLCG